jgi:hypothetical protein
MTFRWQQRYIFSAIVVLAFFLHAAFQHNLMSLFIWPLGIAALLPYTISTSALALMSLVVASELLATLPPGIMTAAVFTPYIIRRIFPKVETGISLPFLALMAGTVAAQLLILVIAQSVFWSWQWPIVWSDVWYGLPLIPLSYVLAFTTVVVFSLAILWREIMPVKHPRPIRS